MTSAYILKILIVAVLAVMIEVLWHKRTGWKTYLGYFVISVISFIVLTFFIEQTEAYGWMDGALLGFFAWLGFGFPKDIASYLWDGRNVKITLINTASGLITFIIAGAILTAWV